MPPQVQILAPVTNNSAAYTLASRLNTLVPSGELKATIASASGASPEVSDVSSDYASFYIALTTLTAAAQAEATPAPKCESPPKILTGTFRPVQTLSGPLFLLRLTLGQAMPLLAHSRLDLVALCDCNHPESGAAVTRADPELVCCHFMFRIAMLEVMAVA